MLQPFAHLLLPLFFQAPFSAISSLLTGPEPEPLIFSILLHFFWNTPLSFIFSKSVHLSNIQNQLS